MARRTLSPAERVARTREMTLQGFSATAIAATLGVNRRTVFDLRKRGAGLAVDAPMDFPDPLLRDHLGPEALATLEDTPTGFKRFCERYSPYTLDRPSPFNGMPAHVFELVSALYDTAAGQWRDRVVVNVAVRHAKTEYLATWFVLWKLAQYRIRAA